MAETNYGSATNNLVESTNKQIKTLCDYNGSLCKFGINFFALIQSSRQETNLLAAIDGLKQLNIENDLGNFVNEYASFLTKLAFDKFRNELKKYGKISITESCSKSKVGKMIINGYPYTSSVSGCVCYFRQSWKLPYVHILTVRKYFNLDLFCPELCEAKWVKKINLENIDLGSTFFIDVEANTIVNETFMHDDSSIFDLKEYLEHERVIIAQRHCQEIAGIITKSNDSDFIAQCRILETLKSMWSRGCPAKLVIEENQNSCGSSNKPKLKINDNEENDENCTNIILPSPM
ncbi:uncharacterized protein LOC130671507 [Microplitis mediator]|uniref:uncharacterized protein LOC130671507 n=1 Tax=Microplitis mediator TaxID=375433 RepID=UPI0025539C53|nr:uncharacterized protein LOC130671507 [Microplitis mediator]